MTRAPGKAMICKGKRICQGVALVGVLLLPCANGVAQTQYGYSPDANFQSDIQTAPPQQFPPQQAQPFPAQPFAAQQYPAQQYPGQQYPAQQYPAQQYPAQQAPAQQVQPQLLSPAQLDNLVAPIALYPDPLLSEVLAASTYPLEVVEAGQWLQQNRNLQGQQLVEAAKRQNWDPSVQAMAAFPEVLLQLNRDVQWTTDLGNAFLAQQADVMDAIQRLRAQASSNGRLTSTPQQVVTTQVQDGQSAIAIQPADPQVIYPPVYNPAYVWGPPAYGAYPPLWYPPVDSGFGFGVASFLGTLFTGLLSWGGWGWGLSWLTHGLFLNGLFFNHFGFHGYGGFNGTMAWAHSPIHRLGVPYPNRFVASRYNAGGYRYDGGYSGNRYGGANLNARMNSPRAEGAGGWRGFGVPASRAGQNTYRGAEGYRSGSEGYRSSSEGFRGSNPGGAVQGYRSEGLRAGGYGTGGYGTGGYGTGAYRTAPSAGYQAPSQSYRGFSGSANSGSAAGYRNSGLSRSFAPSSNHSAPRASSQHFSAPRASSHFSAPHGSSPHFSAPHSSGGHSGGGHSGGGHSGGGGHRR